MARADNPERHAATVTIGGAVKPGSEGRPAD